MVVVEFVGFHTKINNEVIKCIANRAIRFIKNGGYDGDSFICWITPVDRRSFADYFACGTYPDYFIAAGHEGDGISLAAVTGKVIEELLNEKKQSFLLNHFV